MNKKIILSACVALALAITTGTMFKINLPVYAASSSSVAKAQTQTQKQTPVNATSLAIVANPEKYLNKTVKMQATFDKFSTLGLDYSKALRESSKYIGILIQRDDVIDHNIPLSEMKMFLTKEEAEKYIDLDTGDKIQITAKVFSTALGDPWLDVQNITVIKKAALKENKN